MHFTATMAACLLVISCMLTTRAASAEPFLLSEEGSERATTGPGNNIVTFAGKTHVVWQDCNAKGYWGVIRTLDHATGAWSDKVTIGPGVDNHARPTIAVDSKGVLHVVIGGHNTPMHYFHSLAPNDSSQWSKSVELGRGTYPMLVCGPDDTLVLASRPNTHNGVDLYVRSVIPQSSATMPSAGATSAPTPTPAPAHANAKPQGEPRWVKRDLVFRRDPKYKAYVGYNVALAWGPLKDAHPTLHLAADVYEGYDFDKHRGMHQGIVYMASTDLGLSWHRADGQPIVAERGTQDLDVIGDFVAGPKATTPPIVYRNGGLVVDDKNRPYVYFTQTSDALGTPHLVTPEEPGSAARWRELPLDAGVKKKWPTLHVPGARGQLSMTSGGALHVQVILAPIADREDTGRFEARFGIGLLTSNDAGRTFEAREILPYDAKTQVTQPTLERPVGHNELGKDLPGMIYSVGKMRYPAKGEVINTRVFWVRPAP